MSLKISRVKFVNRAPFQIMDLSFEENEIAVLLAANGKGKSTILSHIADAFYEIARPNFEQDFEGRENKLYRVSTDIYSLEINLPSIFFMKFSLDQETFEYLDIRGEINLENLKNLNIGYELFNDHEIIRSMGVARYLRTTSSNLTAQKIKSLFGKNLITFFPSYRYEEPGYLNEPYTIKNRFNLSSKLAGLLPNPLEVISSLKQLANWVLDIVLDMEIAKNGTSQILININQIISKSISPSNSEKRIGIGPRNFGSTRIQIINKSLDKTMYPSIFNLSSGESSLLCIFLEILRQGDNLKNNQPLDQITGVILIDEIDKHLHIKVQKESLPELLQLFPNVQFIISSHSPFLNLGLAQHAHSRSSVIDIDSGGVKIAIERNSQYLEVYEMMIEENQNFKKQLDEIRTQGADISKLRIVTEGNNIRLIKRAITLICPDLISQIYFVEGIEHKTGKNQLKTAFEIMAKTNTIGKFLFIWDCDVEQGLIGLANTSNIFKFCFQLNSLNTKAKKGVENLLEEIHFTDDCYDTQVIDMDYGGRKTEIKFNKSRFEDKILKSEQIDDFINFKPLIDEIQKILSP